MSEHDRDAIARLSRAMGERASEGAEALIEEALSAAREEVSAALRAAARRAVLASVLAHLEQDAPAEGPDPAPGSARQPMPGVQGAGGDLYVYGITTAQAPPPDGLVGVDGAPVRAVDAAGLRALVSPVSGEAFGAALAERAGDAAWVERTVRAHDDVLRALAAAGPLVPLRFGTIIARPSDIEDMLGRRGPALAETLDRLRGSAEWGVKGHWGAEALRAHIDGDDGQARPRGGASGGGAAYLLGRQRAQAVAEEARQTMRSALDACHRRLAREAREAALLPIGGAGARDDDLVLNASYLVADDGLDAFRSAVADLEESYGGAGLRLEMTGPWPAYSFVAAAPLAEEPG